MNQKYFLSFNNKHSNCSNKIENKQENKYRCNDNINYNPCCRNCYIVCPTGPSGGILNYADFYALMPPDNAATVAPGTDVNFLQD